ncbi:hypothetical protein PGQ11_012996 [Apiospora arundinis]|uniref:Uncharacterized protein n=1 Tax=Apiospora arundinis TaxID=335852 RepID=A0ABR2I3W8_9PEZI
MCKQYVYLSICLEHDCDSIVGKKGRNAYCRTARHGARRLGSCDGGIEYVVTGRHRGTVPCDECKQIKSLRQLCVAASKSATAIAAATWEEDGVSTTVVEDIRSEGDDGETLVDDCYSDRENIGKDDDTEPLRFFANRKARAEKLASAYDFDLAVRQELSAQKVKVLFAKTRGEDELRVVSDRDDSTIEYEEKVPDYIRHKEQQAPIGYYGFETAIMGGRRNMFPQPGSRGAAAPEGLSMFGALEQMRDAQYHHPADTAFDSAAATTATLESESEAEVEINSVRHLKLIKEFFNESVLDTTATKSRRRVKSTAARATGKRSDDSTGSSNYSISDDGKETEEKKVEDSVECGPEDEDAGGKTSETLPPSFGFVFADGGKRRRTC